MAREHVLSGRPKTPGPRAPLFRSDCSPQPHSEVLLLWVLRRELSTGIRGILSTGSDRRTDTHHKSSASVPADGTRRPCSNIPWVSRPMYQRPDLDWQCLPNAQALSCAHVCDHCGVRCRASTSRDRKAPEPRICPMCPTPCCAPRRPGRPRRTRLRKHVNYGLCSPGICTDTQFEPRRLCEE